MFCEVNNYNNTSTAHFQHNNQNAFNLKRETSGVLKIDDSRAIFVIIHGTIPLPRCREEKFKLRLSSQPHTKREKKERPSAGI